MRIQILKLCISVSHTHFYKRRIQPQRTLMFYCVLRYQLLDLDLCFNCFFFSLRLFFSNSRSRFELYIYFIYARTQKIKIVLSHT